ncbi:MAG: diacylglycerol kinase family lipid kinase [Calditrichia bacterium]
MEKYALVLNPKAGRGKGQRLETDLREYLSRQLGTVDFFKTEYSGHGKKIAAEIKNTHSVIIAAGGDGTVHEIVNGMMGGKAALAVIPIGSGNDFVKPLAIPKNPREAIEVIRQNQRMKIDVGKMGDRYFPNGLGIGFDAWVVEESNKIKRLRGIFIYLLSVLKTIFKYRNEKVSFTANGKVDEKDIFMISIGNGVAMGGGFYLTPKAKINDGLFDICIIHALKKREVFWHLPKVFHGGHVKMRQVEMFRTNSLRVVSEKGIAAHADGELLGMNLKDLEIQILPEALEVIYNPKIRPAP